MCGSSLSLVPKVPCGLDTRLSTRTGRDNAPDVANLERSPHHLYGCEAVTVPDAVITVGAALDLPALRRALPEVVAGARNLDRPIRWVASSDVPWIAVMLKGGELLLTTGLGFGRLAAEQRRFVDALADRGLAAMAIELGRVITEPPAALVERAEARGLPVVALRREVPFVEITEAIHGAIVNRRYEFLRRGEAVQRRFTELMLEGEGIPEVMAALATTIADPVVLENARGEVLFCAPHGGEPADVLAAWEGRRRRTDALALPVPMEEGTSQGRLTALPLDSPLEDFDRLVLERAVDVIALALLRERQEEELALRGRGDFLSELLRGAVSPRDARDRAESLGFVHRRGPLLPMAVAPVGTRVAARLRSELDGLGLPALVGAHEDDLLALVGLGAPEDRKRVAEQLAGVIHQAASGQRAVVAVAGTHGWDDVGRGLRDAAETAAAAREERPWHDASRPSVDRLLWALRDDAHLRGFADRRLAPVLEHDARRKNALLPTLERLCEHGWHKADTARALHLQRQALYHRVERIEKLLDADLSDPETRLGIELAIRARRYADGRR